MDGNWQVEFGKPGPTVYSNGFRVLAYKPQYKFSRSPQKKQTIGNVHVLEPANKLARYSDHWRPLHSDKVLERDFIQLRDLFILQANAYLL